MEFKCPISTCIQLRLYTYPMVNRPLRITVISHRSIFIGSATHLSCPRSTTFNKLWGNDQLLQIPTTQYFIWKARSRKPRVFMIWRLCMVICFQLPSLCATEKPVLFGGKVRPLHSQRTSVTIRELGFCRNCIYPARDTLEKMLIFARDISHTVGLIDEYRDVYVLFWGWFGEP